MISNLGMLGASAATARRLFLERGFDAVTMDEIAQAAQVARKTVFLYFAAKEDLVLDALLPSEQELIEAARAEPLGPAMLRVVRERTEQVLAERGTRVDGLSRLDVVELIKSSPALRRAADARYDLLARQLAAAIAEPAGLAEHDPVAITAAYCLLGARRALVREYDRRRDAGQSHDEAAHAVAEDADRVFAMLEHGIAPGSKN
jgi:AcrR family transcriptional regulator